MSVLDDGDLWEKARLGETDAFGVLFDRHAGAILAYCFRRTADQALAEDLTSVVFLEAWRKHNDVRLAGDKVLPWLYGVATNVLRNQRRSLRRYRAALERVPPAGAESDFADAVVDRLEREQRMRDILATVASLPRVEQDVLTLCVWQGLSSAAAAQALSVPEPTVRTRLHRARRHLRDQLDLGNDRTQLASAEGTDPR